MSNWKRNPFFWAAVVAGAVIGSSLISDSDDGWTEFFAWIAFFVALNTPVLFMSPDSNRSCAGWLARGRKTD